MDVLHDYQEILRALEQDEELLQFSDFPNSLAIRIGERLLGIARAESLPVTIDIRRVGQQLFHCAMSGTTIDNDEWIKRKNRVVERFGHSSYYMGMLHKSRGTTMEDRSMLDPRRYAPHGGAFPIRIVNTGVVGTVTVSGLTQEDDHRLVVRVLREFVE